VFENILGQTAADQLKHDIKNGCLAPAMLFEGPLSSGKGSAALELGRVISCEKDAAWSCSCPSCSRHRMLLHPDMLCMGNRSFYAEIAAASNVFLREKTSGSAGILFIRSVRKLLSRFNPVLWEDEPKFSKLAPLAASIEDGIDEITAATGKPENNQDAAGMDNLTKLTVSIVKNAFKLESDGMPDLIPIAWIRRAAYWCRLAPSGKEKLLLIENADRMQESARNSLLKLLEEPPDTVKIILTSNRPKTILLTVLSRLRPYRFMQRSAETEREVLRRVFRSENFTPENPDVKQASGSLINAYLDSFLPVPGPELRALAAYFAASAAYSAALLRRKKGAAGLPGELVQLGKYASSAASASGLEKTGNGKEAAATVLAKAYDFEIRSLFTEFNRDLLDIVLESQKKPLPDSIESEDSTVIDFLEIWRTCTGECEEAAMVYNQSIPLVLEQLFIRAGRKMAEM